MKKLASVEQLANEEEPVQLGKYRARRWHIEHHNARTVEEAISLLGWNAGEAQVIAGGVDLVHLIKTAVRLPRILINIKTIPGLAVITEEAEGLRIGALTTIHDIEVSPIIKEKYNLLAEAAHSIAAPQVRNMATIAGNLCQQVRCWYYRRSPITGKSFFCHRKGGEQCYAVAGNNTFHAIITRGECNSIFPSDMAPALIALAAKVRIAGPDGYRLLPLDEFYRNVGNVLHPDEIITEIQVPCPKPGTRQRFLKFRLRKAIDFALSSVAAAVTIEDGRVNDARIIIGGIAPTPYRATCAEESIKGKVITEKLAEIATKAAVVEAIPLSMNTYKLPITRALVRRAILG